MSEPAGISLEKLSIKCERHILLLFGDGHQLIDETNAVLDKEYWELFNRWQYKAIVTPVSFADWGPKETNILSEALPVFPVDMQGLLLLVELLSETENKQDIITRLKQNKSLFYKAGEINFDNVDEIEKYCDSAAWAQVKEGGESVNVLFQWIAALAVYPSIRWEIIIAVGKAILDKYGRTSELNFTSLLRIARISWMKKAVIPAALRLELLKKLTVENEVLTRETLLLLLQEIPAGNHNGSSNANEEKEIQQIINEFSLYAYDPVFYSSYRPSKDVFEKIWKEEKIKDPAVKEYFTNKGAAWKTMLNKQSDKDDSVINVGAEEYFETKHKEETALSKMYLWLGLVSTFVLVASVFGLIILKRWEYL